MLLSRDAQEMWEEELEGEERHNRLIISIKNLYRQKSYQVRNDWFWTTKCPIYLTTEILKCRYLIYSRLKIYKTKLEEATTRRKTENCGKNWKFHYDS